jgi:hypothetical protein
LNARWQTIQYPRRPLLPVGGPPPVSAPDSGAAHLLSEKVDCAAVNTGDGSHDHRTQAFLDALTMHRRKGGLRELNVAIYWRARLTQTNRQAQ